MADLTTASHVRSAIFFFKRVGHSQNSTCSGIFASTLRFP
jgi:hypothetical protein